MTWTKLPPAKKIHLGCLSCSKVERVASLEMQIAVGFGSAYATKDEECVYEAPCPLDFPEKVLRVKDIEEMAAQDPDHDWRIVFYEPLHGETYQRHGSENWVCVESNMGFA